MTRTDMRKKMKKRRTVTLLIVLALVLVSGAVFASKVLANHKVKDYVDETYKTEIEASKENKEVGEVKSDVNYDKNTFVAVHYPKIGQKNIDKDIEKIVNDYVETFKRENKDFEAKELKDMKDFHIDYESYNYKDNINSIKFKINEGKEDEKIRTAVYNVKDDKGLILEDLFIEESLPYISTQAISHFSTSDETKDMMANAEIIESLKTDIKNYSNFIMHNDGVEFILTQISKNDSLKLSYDDLEMYAKYDLETLDMLSAEQIEEKVENSQRGSKIRPGLDPSKPMVALTYDDGPFERVTGPILDQLKKYNGAATFFVLGEKVNANKELLQRMADEGHEIGNHSYSHKQLTKLSVEGLNKEVNDTQAAVNNVVGYEPRLLRPTYGAINETVKTHVPMPLMLWSIDTLDWKFRDSQRVINSILNNVKDGDIILMHDLYDSTRDASLAVIPELVNRGYQLVTLSEMYELKGVELEPGGRYTNID